MHASNETLSRYIHLASEHNNHFDGLASEHSTHVRLRIKKMKTIAELVRSDQMGEKEAITALLSTLDEFKGY